MLCLYIVTKPTRRLCRHIFKTTHYDDKTATIYYMKLTKNTCITYI